MSKKVLAVAIAHAFIANPNEDKLLVTPDGNCFRESAQGNADLHARNTNTKVQVVNREDYAEEIKAETAVYAKREAEVTQAALAAEKAAEEKAAQEAAKKALAERALSLGLLDTATEEEVKAAEQANKKKK